MKYKLIATDLDGTLLDGEGRLSEENREALRALDEKGVHLSIATGRTYAEIPAEVLACEAFRYCIYANGATVLDRKSGEKMNACIGRETIGKMMDIFADYALHITARAEGECYYDARYPLAENEAYYRIDPNHVSCVGKYGVAKEDFDCFVRSWEGAEVFSVYFHDDKEREACRERLLALGNLYVTSICNTNFEIFDLAAGKDKALLRLASHLGVKGEEVMTLGDSGNDMAMTRAAGLGLATANAQKILKDVADGEICSNEEHVMRFVLEKYFG